MSLQIVALLTVALLVGAFAGMTVERSLSQMRRQAWRERNRWRWKKRNRSGWERGVWESKFLKGPFGPRSDQPISKVTDAADQLRIVMNANFTIQPLLNKSEVRVWKELASSVTTRNPGWQVMAQVSLGEILRSKDPEAYSCINSKRIDLLLVDDACQPRHAIEYQGAAHHQSTAAARDAVKKEALRRAGIGYHEVVAGHTTPTDLRQLVEKLVEKPT